MPDKRIADLDELYQVSDEDMLPVQSGNVAYHTTGAAWKAFVRAAIAAEVAAVLSAENNAANYAATASAAASSVTQDRNAIQNMGVSSVILQAGETPTLTRVEDQQTGYWNLIFGLVPGPKGDTGRTGDPGSQGPPGPQGAPASAGSIEAATGLFTFSIGPSTEQATLNEPGHLLLTYAGSETNPNQWYIDWTEGETYGHLFYDPDAGNS